MPSRPRKAALIVVDVQEDFCLPNGSLGVPGGRELAPIINQLLDSSNFALKLAARDYHPVDHVSFASNHDGATPFTSKTTIHNPENSSETQTTAIYPNHCVQNTPGSEIIPEIHKEKYSTIIEKGTNKHLESFSAFGPPFRNPPVLMTRLDSLLKSAGITHLFCAGISYNVCVFYTAVDAVEHGYKTFVIRDATATRQTGDALAATSKALEERGVVLIDSKAVELDIDRLMD